MKIERLKEMLEVIERERGISKEALLDALKASLVSACKKKFTNIENLEADIQEDGTTKIFSNKTVVAKVNDPELEITKPQAKKLGANANLGEIVKINVTPEDFGRLAAQTAKQVIIQRIREAEKEGAFEEFSKKSGEIITGMIQRRERGGYLVNLGRIETFLPASETIPGEIFRPKDRVKLYVVETKMSPKGPHVNISRTNANLVKKLFELEIPEILEGILEIKAIAREAGRRTKIAVLSKDKNVAAVGTCVGQMGSRIQNIVRELGNEKVDIIEWNDDPKRLISNSLSPAKIIKVKLNKEAKEAKVIVPEDQLSLAIGREGQNVRLAAKLTTWKIDIINEKDDAEAEAAAAAGEAGEKKTKKKEKTTEAKESKTKIHELAKELSITSKAILAKAKELEIEAKAATSSLADEDVKKLKEALAQPASEEKEEEKEDAQES
ncbi:MAG: transcription termination factor NusA [Candidatus Margulisbacteria bacterium]|nr:transcription termination factor NusA [Candidatus Margulisiibacteriota bacterium]MBU1021655.1 transcription termination factor NusA [Candidatus Margulisiibacteriota bacterium]MBU1728805.1 transcription termination factor NusA [Candidatus Margulisiibacteriota bacterium]MBU1955771.1 transcription termination factor NusA [Candidatus Margulisiibacteriota bacterium]